MLSWLCSFLAPGCAVFLKAEEAFRFTDVFQKIRLKRLIPFLILCFRSEMDCLGLTCNRSLGNFHSKYFIIGNGLEE